MDYLWYSRKHAHRGTSGKIDDAEFRTAFNDISYRKGGRPTDIAIYLDDAGEPHAVTAVTHTPEHGTGWDDIVLVTTAEKAVWLGGSTSAILPEKARDFCTAKAIEPSIAGILDYIYMREHCALQSPIKVSHALKLGRKAS